MHFLLLRKALGVAFVFVVLCGSVFAQENIVWEQCELSGIKAQFPSNSQPISAQIIEKDGRQYCEVVYLAASNEGPRRRETASYLID